MRRARVRGSVAALVTILVFGLLVAAMKPQREAETQPAEGKAPARPEGKPVPMPATLTGLEISLGLKDEMGTPWGGEIRVSEGKVLEAEVIRGGPKGRAAGVRWTVSSVQQKQDMKPRIIRPVVRAALAAPLKARVNVQTQQDT